MVVERVGELPRQGLRREGRRTIDRRHVTDDGNWSNWNLKILQLEKLQIGGGFLAPSKGSGECVGGLIR